MPVYKTFHRHLPLAILVLFLSSLYLRTLAPGLTWANNGSDGGDLITAAYTGGVAHPTGYPLYLFLARLFQLIPIGSLAYRTNLMSAVAAVSCAVILYRLVTRTLNDQGMGDTRLAGLAAGFAFGLAPLVWSQAVITEVYALQACLTILILYLYTFPFPGWDLGQLDRLRGLVVGLAIGNHVTTLLLFPFALFSRYKRRNGDSSSEIRTTNPGPASSLIRQLVWLAIGLSLYLTLPLRALTDPPVNWGNPVTPRRFWWLVSGELYRSYYLQFQFDEIWGRVQAWASALLQQFGWLGVILGIAGLVLFFTPSRLYLHSIWMGLICTLFALVYTADDSHVYLIPTYISFSIWIGLGIGYLCKTFPSRAVRWGMGVLLLVYFVCRIPGYVGQVDASQDLRAEMFGRQVMSQVPRDALVFVKGDQAVFAVWYFHFALDERPDLVVIAEELLHFDWYQETLQDAYPALDIPGPLPWAQNIADANPNRQPCHVQYTDRAGVVCGEKAGSP